MRQGALDDLAPKFQSPLDGGLQGGKLAFDLRGENDGHDDARPAGKMVLRASQARPTNQNHAIGFWPPASTGFAGFFNFSESTPGRVSLGREKVAPRTLVESGARNE